MDERFDTFVETTDTPTVALVGLAKNSGKTTTLNWLVERVVGSGRTVGVVSVGVDGESVDAVTDRDKPAIFLPSGHWMASAATAFARSQPRFDFARQLGFSTPMGEAFVGETLEAGEVVLAGMRHRGDVRAARDVLFECGAEVVFVDGAFGRSAAGDGRVADAVVLSTGAVAGRTIEAVVEATRPLVEQYRLEGTSGTPLEGLGEAAIARQTMMARVDGEPIELETSSALMGLEDVRQAHGERLEALAVPGAVTERVVEELLAFPEGERTLVVASPASIQTGAEAWAQLRESRWAVRLVYPVQLLGVSANPVGIDGREFDAEALVEALRDGLEGVAIVDPVSGR